MISFAFGALVATVVLVLVPRVYAWVVAAFGDLFKAGE